MIIIHFGTFASIPSSARTLILLGNRSSDHLRELVRIAEFKGRAAYRIEQAADIRPRWLAGVREVGVVVGASGLEPILRAVVERIEYFGRVEAQGMLEGNAR